MERLESIEKGKLYKNQQLGNRANYYYTFSLDNKEYKTLSDVLDVLYKEMNEKDVKLKESKYTMKDILLSWFGKDETNITDSLLYWIEFDSGKAIKVYEYTNNLDELLSRSEGGVSNFYFVEDIYFIEFDTVIMSFILGNNE